MYVFIFQVFTWFNLVGYQIPLEERAESYFSDLNTTLRELELKSPLLSDQQYDFEIAEMYQSIARSEQGALNSGLNIGIVEDNKGRIATELHGGFLHGGGALGLEQFADRGRAGKG